MSRKTTCSLIVFLVACAAFHVFAGKKSPLAIAIATTSSQNQSSAQLPSSDYTIMGGRLALFSAAHRGMYGLAFSVLANEDNTVSGDIAGIQAAGFFNTAGGAEYGAWQIASLGNELGGDGNAMQLAGFYNGTRGFYNGFMLCGLINNAESLVGAQISGLNNTAQKDVHGAQLALLNVSDRLVGVQLGGVNVSGSLVGVQLGVVNWVKEGGFNSGMCGIQIGALNYAESSSGGIQLGVVNVIKDNEWPFFPIFNCYF